MTEPTIDLQNRLEANLTCDDEDTDASRGMVYDRSGYPRTGRLSGGITTGLDSPVGQAYRLDGVDDVIFFTEQSGISSSETEGFTVACMIQPDGTTDDFNQEQILGTNGHEFLDSNSNNGMSFGSESVTTVKVEVGDTTTNSSTQVTGALSEGKWASVLYRVEGNVVSIYMDGEHLTTNDTGLNSSEIHQGSLSNIGQSSRDRDYSGDISNIQVWTRALSDDEAKYVSNMTGNHVSNL